MPRFANPSFVSSLKEARYWSLDWISENNIRGPFNYVILLKQNGGYSVIGQFATASEAFDDRRLLVSETGNRSYFLRAVRVVPVELCEDVGPEHPEAREDLDRWRDALATGDLSLIADDEHRSYQQWVSREIASSEIPF